MIKWFCPDIFPVQIGFVPNEKSWTNLKKYWKEDLGEYPETAARCMYDEINGKKKIFLFVNAHELNEVEREALLVHELMHAVDLLFKGIGEEAPGLETKAYLIQRMYIEFRGELDNK